MKTRSTLEQQRGSALSCGQPCIPELLAEVFEEAPALEDRGRLLQPMLAALGMLSLAAVAGGVFSWLRLVSVAGETQARLDALSRIRSSHVLALAQHAQQVDPEVMHNLVGVLQSSPSLCATAAAAVLLAALARATGRVGGVR